MSAFYVISDDWADTSVAIIALGGEVDLASSPDLRERIFAHINAGRRRLILDLTDVTFIDSTAIGVLVGAVTRLRASGGGSLAVVCPERRDSLSVVVPAEGEGMIRQIIEVTGLDAGVALCSSRDQALAEIALAG
ncbi:MAG: STAS domain-containing protein [Solirubrobacteraceae bacterium]